MVFESIVADILNRYLGEYVENLDKGQLKIGIWGGKSLKSTMFHNFIVKMKIGKEKSIFPFAPTLFTMTVTSRRFVISFKQRQIGVKREVGVSTNVIEVMFSYQLIRHRIFPEFYDIFVSFVVQFLIGIF